MAVDEDLAFGVAEHDGYTPNASNAIESASMSAADLDSYYDGEPAVLQFETYMQQFRHLWCNFCSNPISKQRFHLCKTCGAIICEGEFRGLGCVAIGSFNPGLPFICHYCAGSAKSPGRVSYDLNGTGTRTQAKLTWPVLFVSIGLVNVQSPALDSVGASLQNEYGLGNPNVSSN